ncbi:MAG: hypothetical protein K1X39_01415 [Thermoflexales bacterium]|nr:hypothetical protein [Thermoflexales bacterium]
MKIRLTSPEVMVALKTIGAAEYPPLGETGLGDLPAAELRGALAAGRASLIARGYASNNPAATETGIDLAPVMMATLAVSAVPEAGFWLVTEANGSARRSVRINWTRTVACRTWVDEDDIHTFDFLASNERDAVLAALADAAGIASAPTDTTFDAFAIPAELAVLFKRSQAEGAVAGDIAARLTGAGASTGTAKIVADIITQVSAAGTLLGLSNRGGEGAGAQAVTWLRAGAAGCLVAAQGEGALVQPLTRTTLRDQLARVMVVAMEDSRPFDELMAEASAA